MTDQPKTELEYEFRKTRRLIIWAVAIVSAVLCAGVSALLANSEPVLGTWFIAGTVGLYVVAMAIPSDNIFRKVLNLLPGADIEDLERPDEQASGSEVIADD
jgi:uncharacterized membrane protein YjjP (DUF1212 family)